MHPYSWLRRNKCFWTNHSLLRKRSLRDAPQLLKSEGLFPYTSNIDGVPAVPFRIIFPEVHIHLHYSEKSNPVLPHKTDLELCSKEYLHTELFARFLFQAELAGFAETNPDQPEVAQ